MTDCLFCKIAQKDLDADIVYEDDVVVAFKDINPQAPVHSLIIPRKHLSTLNDVEESDRELMGHIIKTASRLAREQGIEKSGYRLVANCQEGAGQTVFHIHFHLLGGRNLGWPPG